MSDADHIESKRRGSSSEMSETDESSFGISSLFLPDAKNLKQSDNLKEESSEDELSEEDLKLSLVFEVHNLTLIIGGRKLNLKKEQLVSASPVFDRMLNSEFKEAKSTEIRLPGKKFGHFVRFLRYILPGFTDTLKENTVHDMLPLVEEYQTEALKQRIDIFLAKRVEEKGDKISSRKIVDNILEAELYMLSRYLKQCKEVAARKLSHKLTICRGYQDISKDTRLQIYAMRCSIIDESLYSGTLYNPDNPFTPKMSSHRYSRYVTHEFETDSIHVGMQKTEGEKLRAYLQNN